MPHHAIAPPQTNRNIKNKEPGGHQKHGRQEILRQALWLSSHPRTYTRSHGTYFQSKEPDELHNVVAASSATGLLTIKDAGMPPIRITGKVGYHRAI